jgi:hypothetical protein
MITPNEVSNDKIVAHIVLHLCVTNYVVVFGYPLPNCFSEETAVTVFPRAPYKALGWPVSICLNSTITLNKEAAKSGGF